MKPFLLLISILFCVVFASMAQKTDRKTSKMPTGLTKEEYAAYYKQLGRKKTKTGAILAGSGLVSAGIGAILIADYNNNDDIIAAFFPVEVLMGIILLGGGGGCLIEGSALMISGGVNKRKARLILSNEPVQTYRLGTPTRIPSIGIQINLGSK